VVVLLDGVQAFAGLADRDIDIFWGAYLGTEHEILRSGKLAEVKDEIVAVRQQARERHGWIMDTYLLRRSDPRK
jgi:precorrin-6A synthase